MKSYGSAIFFSRKKELLEILDEFLDVTVVECINETTQTQADFLFVDVNTPNFQKVCCFAKHYINKKIVIFFCCTLEQLISQEIFFDDYISIPFSKSQVQYKLKFWKKKNLQPVVFQSEKSYLLEKIDFSVNQVLSLCKDQKNLLFQIICVEWLVKFLHIQHDQITDSFIDEIFNFNFSFTQKFNAKVLIKLSFPIQLLPDLHQRNLLQVFLCISRICCIYQKSILKVKHINSYVYIFLNKKPDLKKDYFSCILFKKIVDQFKNNWQIQKLERGTLFKYTLFEDR